jgi:hypothetical protein
MKKILVLTALRSGSNYVVDNCVLSIEKMYSVSPSHEHYYKSLDDKVTKIDSVVKDDFSVIKLSWLYHLHELSKIDDLSKYDVIFLKRKDKFAQSISMLTAMLNPKHAFNFYKGNEKEWSEWVQTDPKHHITKESFHLYFWLREHLEKGVVEFKDKFKSFTEVHYEDLDGNVENLKKLLENVGLPDHKNHENTFIAQKRNWNKWDSIVNKEEVLGWAEELFSQQGYVIDSKYYKEE